ncbi:hypothetical protein BH11BAC1_BH11BAC1_09200 [soil metagenome]
MKILLDECLPRRIKLSLANYETKTVAEMGWNSLRNGQLMKVAIEQGFGILLTIDKNLEFQQNLKAYQISVVIFDVPKSKIEFILPLIPKFNEMLSSFEKGKAYRIN